MRTFTYVDAVIVDTPIFNPDVRVAVAHDRNIVERLERTDVFRRYLDEQWVALKTTAAPHLFNWEDVSMSLEAEISRIRARL